VKGDFPLIQRSRLPSKERLLALLGGMTW